MRNGSTCPPFFPFACNNPNLFGAPPDNRSQLYMHSYKRKVRKRRMPEEKLDELANKVDFGARNLIWKAQFEAVLFEVLKYEYYLNSVPDNLTIPKYRTVLIRLIFRILAQRSKQKPYSMAGIERFAPRIRQMMEYLVESDFKRRQNLLKRFPITEESIRNTLNTLKKEKEI